MRVGVYVDGYNLYYGGRNLCGRGTTGWRWLDIQSLVVHLLGRRSDWPAAIDVRVVYCTARVDGRTNPDGHRDQDVYLKALLAHGSADHIEYGNFVARTKRSLLATQDRKGRPVPMTSRWPVMVQDSRHGDVSDARFMVQVMNIEEKGSDVNVATHLLLDVLTRAVDAAVVVSNDSDLRLPLHEARTHVPVGLVNSTSRRLAGALAGGRHDGVGRHWWTQLTAADLEANQMPMVVGPYSRPHGW